MQRKIEWRKAERRQNISVSEMDQFPDLTTQELHFFFDFEILSTPPASLTH